MRDKAMNLMEDKTTDFLHDSRHQTTKTSQEADPGKRTLLGRGNRRSRMQSCHQCPGQEAEKGGTGTDVSRPSQEAGRAHNKDRAL